MESATKGTIYLIIAQIVMIISGYLTHFVLGRYLGPESYGTYGLILTIATTLNLILTSGIPTSVSKFIAEQESRSKSILKKALKIQLIFSIIISLLFLASAHLISTLLQDSSLTNYFRLMSIVIIPYSLFSILIGYFNGKRLFKTQAILNILYSIARAAAIIGLAFLFHLYGTIIAFMISPIIILIIALYLSRKDKSQDNSISSLTLIKYAIPISIFAVIFNFVQTLDLYFVKSLLKQDILTGYYTASITISRVPLYILASLTIVILPLISNSLNDRERTKRLINSSTKYALIALMPLTILFATTSKKIISLFYSNVYSPASTSLSILTIAIFFFTIYVFFSAILNGAGKQRVPMYIILFLLVIDFFLLNYLVPKYQLTGAAISTLIVSFLAFLLSSIVVYKEFKALISFRSLVRILFASLILLAPLFYTLNKYFLPLEYIVLTLLYLIILYLFKEIRKQDIKELLPTKFHGILNIIPE
ncbi:MAG TPA: flippase [Candidatus Nanoarchaeia archaeon]|nr:flippase [Candidatus Nanoarchaeia archaeon]